MHSQDTHCAGRTEATQLVVRPEIAPAWLRMLEQDRMPDDWTVGPERDVTIDHLTTAIQAGKPIDLAASRSASESEHDGQSRTTGGYLLGLIRDKFINRDWRDWREFIALGALAVDIEAAAQA